jgi:hypothetical protein
MATLVTSFYRHEFHKKCVDPWLRIKQTCPMCKCSITTTPSSDTPLREVLDRSVSPSSDDLSVVNLGEEEEHIEEHTDTRSPHEADTGSNHGSDTTSTSEPASDSPLIPIVEELTVNVLPYSPQVEVNMEQLLPGVSNS